jgi:hypothetical protein
MQDIQKTLYSDSGGLLTVDGGALLACPSFHVDRQPLTAYTCVDR